MLVRFHSPKASIDTERHQDICSLYLPLILRRKYAISRSATIVFHEGCPGTPPAMLRSRQLHLRVKPDSDLTNTILRLLHHPNCDDQGLSVPEKALRFGGMAESGSANIVFGGEPPNWTGQSYGKTADSCLRLGGCLPNVLLYLDRPPGRLGATIAKAQSKAPPRTCMYDPCTATNPHAQHPFRVYDTSSILIEERIISCSSDYYADRQ